jgi:putative hemolysin
MEILILVGLILLNGFFALSEIALVSSKRAILEQYSSKGNLGARKAIDLLNNSENFLSSIQVGITLIGIVTGVYGGINFANQLEPILLNINFIGNYANELALAITVIIITYFSIVIGELVPKTIAINNSEKIAIIIAPIIYYISLIFYPFVKILSTSTSIIVKFIGIKENDKKLTESEIRYILKFASSEGIIEKEQNEIHEKVFYFADKKAKHIMVHRKEVEWIDITKSSKEIFNELLNIQHSKIICCEKTLDNFKGVLAIKDFFKNYAINRQISLKNLLTEPLIVNEDTEAKEVLINMRMKKKHICVVVNEFGGFEGLITLHDILENIIGEIPEEGEMVEPDYYIREDNTIFVSGDAPIETLCKFVDGFSIDFEQINYSTVAGFILSQIAKVPQIGDKFDYLGYTFEIVDIDRNKIDKILIYKF